MSATIQVSSGELVDILNLQPQDIFLEDIAHSLSNQCRYFGHCNKYYSVAEHCVLMARLMQASVGGVTTDTLSEALLHDATEAYIGDMARPLKHLPQLEFYRDLEDVLWHSVARRFGLCSKEKISDVVKFWDYEMLCIESKQLFSVVPAGWDIQPNTDAHIDLQYWLPDRAKEEFIVMALEQLCMRELQ